MEEWRKERKGSLVRITTTKKKYEIVVIKGKEIHGSKAM